MTAAQKIIRSIFGSGSVVYWLLVLMGLLTFVPCVVLPEWRKYQSIQLAEQEMKHRVEVQTARLKNQERHLDALRSDPAALFRLARRDYGYRHFQEKVVPLEVANYKSEFDIQFTPQPVEPPVPIKGIVGHLPEFEYDAIFCHEDTRLIVLGLSTLLLTVAVVVLGKREFTVHNYDA